MKKFSIITTVFNGEETIAKTIESVISQTYNNYEYIIEFENYYESFTNWINKKNIKKVGLPYVTKGNWKNIYKKLISNNPSINFVYLHRKYDMNSWKFAKKGFFNFKKHIPELISKL